MLKHDPLNCCYSRKINIANTGYRCDTTESEKEKQSVVFCLFLFFTMKKALKISLTFKNYISLWEQVTIWESKSRSPNACALLCVHEDLVI